MGECSGPVVGVVGGSGGVGASSFAAIMALVAGPAVLIDLDCAGGGVDVVLGVEQVPGARWSGLHVAGGHLDPRDLVDGLPHAAGCAVLAADTESIDADAVRQVIAAAAGHGTVVLDLPRDSSGARAAALVVCDLVVLLARADISGLVAAHTMAATLTELPVGLVVRRGDVDPDEAAGVIGLPLLGVLPGLGAGRFRVDPRRPPRAGVRVAEGVLAGLGRASASGRHSGVAGVAS